ncbi:MAG: alpha-N-acetylgalactosaminidase, partial [Akkermansia sp.]
DYVMLYRMIECLRKGEPMDQNVYEGAFWSAVTPLSIQSVAEGGMPIVFPDFTRGDWKTTAPLGIVE